MNSCLIRYWSVYRLPLRIAVKVMLDSPSLPKRINGWNPATAPGVVCRTSAATSDVILSIALYPRWVSLFFARGKSLPDPDRVLRGSGNQMRHVVLDPVSVLDSPPVRALIRAAVSTHPKRLPRGRGRTIVKAVSAKQRPRRPRGKGARG